jgi:1-phosphofructokinase family hexose kinase
MGEPIEVVTITLNPAIDQTISIPNFRAGAVNRVEHSNADAGGKGVNVAAALADDGVRVAVSGFLGEQNDTIFRQLFVAKQIDDRFVRIAGSTRIGIKITDAVADETTDINFPGEQPTAANQAHLLAIMDELAQHCKHFVLAGSVPAGMQTTIYAELVSRLKAQGVWVALDTSGAPLAPALAAGPDLIKPNEVELHELIGTPLPDVQAIVTAARQLAERYGIGWVVVSMGKDGAVFVRENEALLAVPAPIEVVSTVGAGDAMVAGLVAGSLRQLPLDLIARRATAFSMGAIGQLGSGLPPRSVIDALAERVRVSEVTG